MKTINSSFILIASKLIIFLYLRHRFVFTLETFKPVFETIISDKIVKGEKNSTLLLIIGIKDFWFKNNIYLVSIQFSYKLQSLLEKDYETLLIMFTKF